MITTLSARVLGQRVRQLRTRRGMTQQDLAGDDYSKSYISAIEQGKTRPSLEALQRIASRLDISPGNLLDPDAPGFVPADPEAMPRRVRRRRGVRAGSEGGFDPAQQDIRLSEAEMHIYTGQANQALEILRPMLPDEAATPNGGAGPRLLDQSQQQRAYSLASLAAVQVGNATEALGYVQKGMQLATSMGDRESLEQMRLVLGIAYFQADQPLSALEHHRTCLEAVNSGVVPNPNFKLRVLSNIAADYWALHDSERAIDAYKSSLDLLKDLNSIERQANVFWQASTDYTADRHYSAARAAATRALSIYEALDNMQTVAKMESRYGNILIETGDIEQAEQFLRHSLQMAESLNSEADRAVSLSNLAKLALRQGNLDAAYEMSRQAVEIGRATQISRQAERGKQKASGKSEKGAAAQSGGRRHEDTAEALAGALALSGEIAAQRNDAEQADATFKEAIGLLESGEAGALASDIYQRYAQVLAGRGQHEQASSYFERAYREVTRRTR